RVLDLVRDTGRELTERGKLLCLNKSVLGGAQILQGGGQFARASLNAFKQTDILNCDSRLVSECGRQFGLFIGEWADRVARQHDDSNWSSFAHKRDTEHGTESTELLPFSQGVFRVGGNVVDLDWSTFSDRASKHRPTTRHDGALTHKFIVFS